jgi:two-component system cell cycle response regulator CtrA
VSAVLQRVAPRIEQLEAENEELRALVAELKLLAFGEWTAPPEWRLTAAQQRVFAFLLKRGFARRDQIAAALWSDRHERELPNPRTMDVQVCLLRRKLAPFGVTIRTVWGSGYALNPEDRARLRGVLEEGRDA